MHVSEDPQLAKSPLSLLPVYFIGFLNFTSMTLLYPVMPPYAASLGGTVTQVGLAVALQSYIASLTQAPVGLLSDRLGRRTLLLAGILVYTFSYFAYLLTASFGALMVVRAINGLGNAAFYPAASALVVDIAPREKRGEALGIFATATQLGSMAGPALGGFLLQSFNFTVTFLASAVISIMGLLLAISRLKYLKPAAGIIVIREKLSIRWLWDRDSLISLVATLLVMVAIASVISFLPLYGPDIQINMARVGLIIATIYVGSVLARIQAGRLSDKLGRMPVILVGLFLCALGTSPFFFLTTPVPMHLAALVLGIGAGSALPACSALIADRAPLRMRGFAMGLNSGSFNAGMALGATGLGVVADMAGFPRMYLVTTIILAISTLAIFLMTRNGPSHE